MSPLHEKLKELLVPFNIIPVDNMRSTPSYPYATFQDLWTNRSLGIQVRDDELINNGLDINQQLYKQIPVRCQIDVYSDVESEAVDNMKIIVDGINFTWRYLLNEAEIGILEEPVEIKPSNFTKSSKVIYRRTVELEYNYSELISRTMANMQSVTYSTDGDSDKVERGG